LRPRRIEVQGFSAYRRSETVDFTDVDFFSLTGPTGSGKSSLIDAMIFALYGRVPRLGGNAVAPAITAGADRARVRFDFEVDDVGYTAVRLAQRTPSGGASVKEARLQMGDQVLADGADDVTEAVAELLKLRFEDFIRTVVLPQGEFARFLTATKSERQGLLRNLLGMDVYTRVRELARTRAAVATDRAEGARRALEALQVATHEEMEAGVARRDSLAALADSMEGREKGLAELESAVAAASAEVVSLSDGIARLSSIDVPERLAELDQLASEARAALVDATENREQAEEIFSALSAELSELVSPDQVVSWRRSWQRVGELDERIAEAVTDVAAARVGELGLELEAARTELASSRSELETRRGVHAAHVLAATLTIGDNCPVCERVVTDLPTRDTPAGLDDLSAEVDRLQNHLESLSVLAADAATELTRVETRRAELVEQRSVLKAELEEAPREELLADVEAELGRVTAAHAEARDRIVRCQVDEKAARDALESVAEASRRVSKLLTTAQLKVADLDPPVSESDDVVVQWKELAEWRAVTTERLAVRLEEAGAAARGAEEAAEASRLELVEILESHEVEPIAPYAVAVATALQSARSLVESQAKTAQEAADLAKRVLSASTEAAVADALAGHLRANGFEQWLMSGALHDLVAGANELLGQLSAGGYSLHSDDSGSFSIVDHRNADEMRSVATLSGGETFLVSLALALSLAETLAAKGGAGLDAIILDEGFGTLDDDSLDTVATVLEELTGRGLMVGVITHVKDLAARAPVRYEVSREVGGAAVRLTS
jgi:DNA repair protein SbcC/Rad50